MEAKALERARPLAKSHRPLASASYTLETPIGGKWTYPSALTCRPLPSSQGMAIFAILDVVLCHCGFIRGELHSAALSMAHLPSPSTVTGSARSVRQVQHAPDYEAVATASGSAR